MTVKKIQKTNEPFDMTVSHDFEPSEELFLSAQKLAQQIRVSDDEATEKMHKCKHDRLWRFSVGMPSDIIGCYDCDYWQFVHI